MEVIPNLVMLGVDGSKRSLRLEVNTFITLSAGMGESGV